MFVRVIAILVILLSMFAFSACAEELPVITGADGEALDFAAAQGVREAPASGEWNALVEAAVGGDADTVKELCTKIAIKATDMNFNSYANMTYAEKVSVVLSLMEYSCSEASFSFYGQGENAADNSVIPVFGMPGGDYAIFALGGGAWSCISTFALTGAKAAEDEYFHIDISGYALGARPVYVACYVGEDGWRCVGLNQAYIDAAIDTAF